MPPTRTPAAITSGGFGTVVVVVVDVVVVEVVDVVVVVVVGVVVVVVPVLVDVTVSAIAAGTPARRSANRKPAAPQPTRSPTARLTRPV
jgi:hypothetical protein